MPMYDVTVTGYYQCKGPGGKFLPRDQFTRTIQFELDSPDDPYQDELFAILAQDAPPDCFQIGGVSTSIAPSAYGPGVDEGIGTSPPDDRPIGTPGQLVTIYGTVACEDQGDGNVYYRNVRADVLWNASTEEVIAALYDTAEGLAVCDSGGKHGTILGITVTAPAYFQYLTVV